MHAQAFAGNGMVVFHGKKVGSSVLCVYECCVCMRVCLRVCECVIIALSDGVHAWAFAGNDVVVFHGKKVNLSECVVCV